MYQPSLNMKPNKIYRAKPFTSQAPDAVYTDKYNHSVYEWTTYQSAGEKLLNAVKTFRQGTNLQCTLMMSPDGSWFFTTMGRHEEAFTVSCDYKALAGTNGIVIAEIKITSKAAGWPHHILQGILRREQRELENSLN